VVYLNSVIGARTMKYPNYLDLLLAITGRARDAAATAQ
jgi:predicted aconitase